MLTMIKERGKQVNYNNYLNTTLLGRLSENLVPGFYTNRTNVIFGRDMRCKASSLLHIVLCSEEPFATHTAISLWSRNIE